MVDKKGNLNINSENIFPIIKKWLYQDHDIFFREMISNGCDAVTKLKKLSLIGEYTAMIIWICMILSIGSKIALPRNKRLMPIF